MFANNLVVTVLAALAAVALILRVAIGPIASLTDKDGAYALAKIGSSLPDAMAVRVEMARSDVRAGD